MEPLLRFADFLVTSEAAETNGDIAAGFSSCRMFPSSVGGGDMPADVVKFGDALELDRNSYELRRGGRALKLERIPLDICSYSSSAEGNSSPEKTSSEGSGVRMSSSIPTAASTGQSARFVKL